MSAELRRVFSPRLLRGLSLCGLWLGGFGAVAAPRTYRITPDAGRIQFVVEAPLDDISGVSRSVLGSIRLDVEDWSQGSAVLAADLKTFHTGIALRDEDLRDQFFQVERYPSAGLELRRLERASVKALIVGVEAQADALGTFSLHGVRKELRVPVHITREQLGGKNALRVHGTFEVAFSDYAIPRPSRLFLKLGDTAKVSFDAVFVETPAEKPAEIPVVGPEIAASLPSIPVLPVVAHRHARKLSEPESRPKPPAFFFSLTKPEVRGERLFRDPSVGGPGNALSCASCHALSDERLGIVSNGQVKPASSLWDSGQRGSYWRGFAKSLPQAVDLCTRAFMVRHQGAEPRAADDVAAYLQKLSPDATAPRDYSAVLFSRQTGVDRATSGDSAHGQVLLKRYCESCHAEGSVRPPLTRGLYEPDYLVRRVRWIEGYDNQQMPPIPDDRLTDTELRDIVTYLAGDPKERIFERKLHPNPK